MKKFLLSTCFLAIALLIALAPTLRTAEAQTNLLTNPSLEEPFSNGAAQGWGRWHEDTGKKPGCAERYSVLPTWSPESVTSALILDGARSQHIGNQFDTWRAGVSQDVAVTAGTTYRFSAWGLLRASNDQYPTPSDRSISPRIRVGIDPNGGGVWTAGSIVWSQPINPHDNWGQTAVEATATGSKVTVFIEADFTGANYCRAHLDAWFDKAELISSAPPPTAVPAVPTAAPAVPTAVPPTAAPAVPTAAPTETPVPTPTAVPPTATPAGGSICINAFGDNNANGQHEATEGYMAGIRFTVAQGGNIVGEGVGSGTSNAVCFEGLPPGNYQVAQTVPGTLEMTTVGNISVDVVQGNTVGIEFGSRVKQESPATEPAAQSPTAVPETAAPTTTPETADSGGGLGVAGAVGLGVIGVAILLIVVLVALFALQRRK